MIEKHVRLAKKEDLPVLLRMAKNFFQASPYRGMKFDREKTKKMFEGVIEGSLHDAVVLVSIHLEKVTGMIIGMANQPAFSSNKIATELAWWVEPDARGSRGSLLLYAAYEDWAKRIGCSHVHGAYLPGVSPDLDGFYKKRGYFQVESSYIKTLKVM